MSGGPALAAGAGSVGTTSQASFDPTPFVVATAVVVVLFLALARLSQSTVREDPGRDPAGAAPPARTVPTDSGADRVPGFDGPSGGDEPALTTGVLLANVALTQGLFGAVLLAAAWHTGVPARAFGVAPGPWSSGLPALAVGVALGTALYATNQLGAAGADAAGIEYDERLRGLLAPDSTRGWAVLLLVVLPVVAGVEEFVFRAALVGVPAAGYGISPWPLAAISSLAFALGHGAQGRVGVAVTGTLGFVLAATFVVTGSFLAVFLAHYLVNALEFLVHELLGVEWTP